MWKTISLALLVTLGVGSCKKEAAPGWTEFDTKFAKELRTSPETLSLGNNTLTLKTNLWRDFMPAAEENGSKMICINSLFDVDSIPFSDAVELKRQHVINGNEVWTAEYTEIRKYVDYKVEGVARNGPKWGPDIYVDVVCEFEYAGKTYRIMAKSQLIEMTI